MMSMIKVLSLFSFKVRTGDRNDDVKSVTIRYIFYELNGIFKPENFTEAPSTLLNEFMQGLVISHVCLEYISFKPNNFHVDFRVIFPCCCHHTSEYHDTVWDVRN